jgi:hypothetical protein
MVLAVGFSEKDVRYFMDDKASRGLLLSGIQDK